MRITKRGIDDMLFEPVQRHYAVCALQDLESITRRDPDLWNLISILDTSTPPVPANGFLKRMRVTLDDLDQADSTKTILPEVHAPSRQIEEVFRFADLTWGEPLLVHCKFGESRSPAMALLLMIRDMKLDGYAPGECAISSKEFLLKIRPRAKPNSLILESGLRMLYDDTECRLVRDAWKKT